MLLCAAVAVGVPRINPVTRRSRGAKERAQARPGSRAASASKDEIPISSCESLAEGAPTTALARARVLCGRHHSVAHQRGLTATATGVTWQWWLPGPTPLRYRRWP